jgi:feruloyl-CoA synthase
MLVFPDWSACRSLCPEVSPDSKGGILGQEAVRERIQSLLESFAKFSTGNSNRVMRAALVDEPPSLDAGEVTDKGSLNQRAVLDLRSEIVKQLYSTEPSPQILRIKEK